MKIAFILAGFFLLWFLLEARFPLRHRTGCITKSLQGLIYSCKKVQIKIKICLYHSVRHSKIKN